MIELRKNPKFRNIDKRSVANLCSFILKRLDLGKCTLSVSLVDDKEITLLNKKYFNKNVPTDVISFPMEEKVSDGILLGDVVVCVPQAQRSAKENNQSVSEELSLYLIHGILHLIGERDGTQIKAKVMGEKQKKLLESSRLNGHLAVVFDLC